MIKIATKTKDVKILKSIKNIYDICFDDSAEYSEHVFRNKYKQNTIIYKEIDDKIVASLLIVIKKLKIRNKEVICGYISGVSTLPKYRNCGYSKLIMKASYKWLQNMNISICTLYPFKHSFYEKMGFITYSKACSFSIKSVCNKKIMLKNVDENDVNLINFLYINFFAPYCGYIIRSVKLTKLQINEITSAGSFALLYYNNLLVGYIAYDDFEVIEYCADIKYLDSIFDVNGLKINLPIYHKNTKDDIIDFAMLKVIDRNMFLKDLDLENDSLLKQLDDYHFVHCIMGSYKDFCVQLNSIIEKKFPPKKNYIFDRY